MYIRQPNHQKQSYHVPRAALETQLTAIMKQQQQQQRRRPCISGHAPSIDGAWVLDLSRSETMDHYLELNGVPAESIEAHVTAERNHQALNLIQLDADTLTIHKQTYANNYTEISEVGKEKFTSDDVTGAWKASVVSFITSGPTGYVQSTRGTLFLGDEAHTRETRYITEGGLSHVQEIYLRNLATGEECVTTRTWRRVAMTHEHRATLALLIVAQTAR